MHTVHSPNSSVFLSVLELYWDPDNWPHRTASSILPPSSLPFVTWTSATNLSSWISSDTLSVISAQTWDLRSIREITIPTEWFQFDSQIKSKEMTWVQPIEFSKIHFMSSDSYISGTRPKWTQGIKEWAPKQLLGLQGREDTAGGMQTAQLWMSYENPGTPVPAPSDWTIPLILDKAPLCLGIIWPDDLSSQSRPSHCALPTL